MKNLESGVFPGTRAKMNFRSYAGIYYKKNIGSQGWELENKFLLFTETNRKGQDLIITSHGTSAGWLGSVSIPANTTLNVLGPHGHALFDPGLTTLMGASFKPYAKVNNQNFGFGHVNRGQVYEGKNEKRRGLTFFAEHSQSLKSVAGTAGGKNYRNYYLVKYEKDTENDYHSIRQFIELNMHACDEKLPTFNHRRMDVLSVRSPKVAFIVTLKDAFKALNRNGIHYENIYLCFCRCSWNPLASYRAGYHV